MVLSEILRNSLTQFDPEVVKVFLTIPESIWHDLRKEIDQQIYRFVLIPVTRKRLLEREHRREQPVHRRLAGMERLRHRPERRLEPGRLRAGGAGVPAFYTPTGVGTQPSPVAGAGVLLATFWFAPLTFAEPLWILVFALMGGVKSSPFFKMKMLPPVHSAT